MALPVKVMAVVLLISSQHCSYDTERDSPASLLGAFCLIALAFRSYTISQKYCYTWKLVKLLLSITEVRKNQTFARGNNISKYQIQI